MSDSQRRSLVKATPLSSGFSRGGQLSKREREAYIATREERLRQQLAIEGKKEIEMVAARATAEMYEITSMVYDDTVGAILDYGSRSTNPVQVSFTDPFNEDQCLELQRDLKGLLKLGVNEMGSIVDTPMYQPAPPKKRGLFW